MLKANKSPKWDIGDKVKIKNSDVVYKVDKISIEYTASIINKDYTLSANGVVIGKINECYLEDVNK